MRQPSHRRNPVSQCIGKHRHKSRRGAIIEAQRAKESGLEAYHCSYCGGWHVGHPIGWLAKRLMQRT